MQKSHQNGEPKRYSWGTQKKKKKLKNDFKQPVQGSSLDVCIMDMVNCSVGSTGPKAQ